MTDRQLIADALRPPLSDTLPTEAEFIEIKTVYPEIKLQMRYSLLRETLLKVMQRDSLIQIQA